MFTYGIAYALNPDGTIESVPVTPVTGVGLYFRFSDTKGRKVSHRMDGTYSDAIDFENVILKYCNESEDKIEIVLGCKEPLQFNQD